MFQSSELNNFLSSLDRRYSDKIKIDGVLMAKKLRTKGTDSSLPPPHGAPAWTVCEGRKGSNHNHEA